MSRRGRHDEGPDGLAIVDKPAGWTSHDVVAKARGLLGTRKVGHAGTLDPDVTGVLVLGVGRATRLLRYVGVLGKHYESTFVLGVETTTLDASGEVVAVHDMNHVSLDDVQKMAAERFVGPILQVPPMVSAVKVGGHRLHELARQGIEVPRDPRPVTIHAFTVDERVGGSDDQQAFRFRVECSSGTYVRSLVADLGTALGGGAHLSQLRRVAVGSFGVDEAVALSELSVDHLHDLADTVRDLAQVRVDQSLAERIVHGTRLSRDELGVDATHAGPWAVLNGEGTLLAVYEDRGAGIVKPSVVVAHQHPTPKPPDS